MTKERAIEIATKVITALQDNDFDMKEVDSDYGIDLTPEEREFLGVEKWEDDEYEN